MLQLPTVLQASRNKHWEHTGEHTASTTGPDHVDVHHTGSAMCVLGAVRLFCWSPDPCSVASQLISAAVIEIRYNAITV
jgi:hypothetical protein